VIFGFVGERLNGSRSESGEIQRRHRRVLTNGSLRDVMHVGVLVSEVRGDRIGGGLASRVRSTPLTDRHLTQYALRDRNTAGHPRPRGPCALVSAAGCVVVARRHRPPGNEPVRHPVNVIGRRIEAKMSLKFKPQVLADLSAACSGSKPDE
jgi:hypothetical protein